MAFTQINVHDTVRVEVDAGQACTAVIDSGSRFS